MRRARVDHESDPLADDHALVRADIRSLLSRIADVEVVAEAQGGHEVLQLIVKNHPGTAVIILSMHAAEECALRALGTGAVGYRRGVADQPDPLERLTPRHREVL